MSEIVLSNASNQYVADYSNGSLMTNFDPAMVQKVGSPTASSPPVPYHDGSQQYQGKSLFFLARFELMQTELNLIK